MKKFTLIIIYILFCFCKNGIGSSSHLLVVTDYGNPSFQSNATGYSIDSNIVEYNFCGITPSIHIAIIDSISCNPLNNCNRDFGQYNIFNDPDGDCAYDPGTIITCRTRAENFFIYRDNDVTSIRQMSQLLDSIDNGHIIIAYSAFAFPYSTMDTSFKNVFQRLGSNLIPTIADSIPFIFICRKGDINSINEVVGSTWDDSISASMTYQCSPTAITELNYPAIHLYPNPVEDILHIDFQKSDFTGELKIYDALGNLISSQKHATGEVILNTQKFSPGIYFVRFESANYFSSVKFCKTE